MDLTYKTYKVFLVSQLPDDIKKYFIDYNTNKVKNIALFFTTGKVEEGGINVNDEIITKEEYVYPIYNYFCTLDNETILIYYDKI